jgi:hypothetical protein
MAAGCSLGGPCHNKPRGVNALMALALWLAVFDIARRTVR